MNETLSQKQLEIFNGSMLGDGTLNSNYKNSNYTVARRLAHKEYLQWQADQFSDFCKPNCIKFVNQHNKKYNKIYHAVKFSTKCSELFTSFRRIWYPEGIKIVPKIDLTPLTLAVWLADDGCISVDKRTNTLRSKFATHSFTITDVEYLFDRLCKITNSRFCIIHEKNNYYYIQGSKKATISLINIVSPVFPPGMQYKLNKALMLI